MIVLYEHDSIFDVYSVNDKKEIKKSHYFGGFDDALYFARKQEKKVTLLLEESRFHYYSYRIECTSRDPFTITDFKGFLKEKLKQISRRDGVSCEYCNHTVENCSVNGKSVEHYIGKQGDISFDLQIIVLKKDASRDIKHAYGSSYISNPLFTILPRTFYLMTHLKKTLKKDNFSLLMIYKNSCTLLGIHRGFYNRCETVNMGEKLLKACYKEHDIDKYLYEGYDRIEGNTILKRLVEESLLFYSQQVCYWLQQYLVQGYDFLLMSNLLHNPLFIDTLQKHYHENSNGYIVPLNTVFHELGYTYDYTPNEIPVVATYVLGE